MAKPKIVVTRPRQPKLNGEQRRVITALKKWAEMTIALCAQYDREGIVLGD